MKSAGKSILGMQVACGEALRYQTRVSLLGVVRAGTWCCSKVIKGHWSCLKMFPEESLCALSCFHGTESEEAACFSGDRALSGL